MPRGTFEPLKNPVRFFARLAVFTVECPFCGRLLFIGRGERDMAAYDPMTSRVCCPADQPDHAGRRGCGRRFLVGIVAWPIKPRDRAKPQPPPDQIPTPEQRAEIRAETRRRRARFRKQRSGHRRAS